VRRDLLMDGASWHVLMRWSWRVAQQALASGSC
jgi:hypothetical protein